MAHSLRRQHSDARRAAVLGILETIAVAPRHAYGIATSPASAPVACIHGEVYPLLHRLEQAGWITGHWRATAGGRGVKYYALAPTGRRVLVRSNGQRRRPYHACGAATALACSMAATPAAAQDSGTLPRVRSSSPFIRDVLSRGTLQSPTFRGLVAAIAETDGIVYVENGHCGHGVHNCLLLSVIPAGGFRFLKIIVKAGRPDPSETNELIASMGHELRHALEVLTEPHVRSAIGMFSLYANQAAAQNGHFETAAAVRAGDQVLSELSGLTSHRVSRTPDALISATR